MESTYFELMRAGDDATIRCYDKFELTEPKSTTKGIATPPSKNPSIYKSENKKEVAS